MKQRTRIKICGVMSVEIAEAAAEAGADAIGLVFAKNSPRRIDLDTAIKIGDAVALFVTVIGLFQLTGPRDPELRQWWGKWVQLHGSEDEALVEQVAKSHKVVRGFRFDENEVRRWERCPHVDSLLIDGSSGGSGTSFDHSRLIAMQAEITKPVTLAGGLTAGNVGEAIRAVRPFAVDVSSGVETKPGVKDGGLIRAFCDAVRRADAT